MPVDAFFYLDIFGIIAMKAADRAFTVAGGLLLLLRRRGRPWNPERVVENTLLLVQDLSVFRPGLAGPLLRVVADRAFILADDQLERGYDDPENGKKE